MNVTQVLIDKFRLNLTGQMHQWRTRRVGLNEPTRRIACARSSAGDKDPKATRCTGICIGHVARPSLSA